MPSVYTRPLLNRYESIQTDPKLDPLFWIHTGPVPETINEVPGVYMESFETYPDGLQMVTCKQRLIQSGSVWFGMVLVRSHKSYISSIIGMVCGIVVIYFSLKIKHIFQVILM